ncbi:hypothetical protein TNCV_2774081 [Trichonephila clavipes]|nr:hypothetical protein TNCV_2774081 [Trichonephila clavipes]
MKMHRLGPVFELAILGVQGQIQTNYATQLATENIRSPCKVKFRAPSQISQWVRTRHQLDFKSLRVLIETHNVEV